MPQPAKPRSAGTQPVWDRDAALAAVAGDENLALQLLADLVSKLPLDLEALRESHRTGALEVLADRAHKIRGGASYCGVSALIEALTALDRAAKQGDADAAAAALAQTEHEILRLTEFNEQR
jgi:two-component system sensor histidine kinase BarA